MKTTGNPRTGYYLESALGLDMTQVPHFRFQDLESYKEISGETVSECDFSFWDNVNQSVCLLEIKNFNQRHSADTIQRNSQLTVQDFLKPRSEKQGFEARSSKFYSIVNALLDAVWMMQSIGWLTPWGQSCKTDIDYCFHSPRKLKVFLAIDLPSQLQIDPQNIASIEDGLQSHLRGKMKLANFTLNVISLPVLKNAFPSIKIYNSESSTP